MPIQRQQQAFPPILTDVCSTPLLPIFWPKVFGYRKRIFRLRKLPRHCSRSRREWTARLLTWKRALLPPNVWHSHTTGNRNNALVEKEGMFWHSLVDQVSHSVMWMKNALFVWNVNTHAHRNELCPIKPSQPRPVFISFPNDRANSSWKTGQINLTAPATDQLLSSNHSIPLRKLTCRCFYFIAKHLRNKSTQNSLVKEFTPRFTIQYLRHRFKNSRGLTSLVFNGKYILSIILEQKGHYEERMTTAFSNIGKMNTIPKIAA